jgi:hypothetical protein
MKKRLLIIGLLFILLLITLFLVKYAIDRALRKAVLREELASIIPANPLAYVQCSCLRTRLKQFMDSPDYQRFIQSEFVKQLQQDERSAKFLLQFDQLWHSLYVDPMHIIGTDAAVAVYNAERGEIIPGVILVSKVDQIAKIAERVSYAFDRLGAGIGITFEQEYQHFSIYRIEQPDMICPLYYAIVEDIGMISTSHSLLKKSIRLALSPALPGVKTSPFTKIIQNIPGERFVTGYLDFSLFFKELRENVLFRSLEQPQKNVEDRGQNLPFLTIHLDTFADEISLRTELFSVPDIPTSPGDHSEGEVDYLLLQDHFPADISLVAAFYKEYFTSFLQNWQELFPQQKWFLPIQTLDHSEDVFGEVIECRVSNTVIGMLYAIPDLTCILDTQNPGRAITFLDTTTKNIFDQILPPIAQRAVKISREPYRGTKISKVQVIFQELLNYGTVKTENRHSQKFYTLVATNGRVLKEQIDSLQTQGKRPYMFPLQQDHTAFVILLQNKMLSKLIRDFSRTNTFSLLFPRHIHTQLYQLLPFLIHFLDPLPPVLLEGGTKGTGLYLELRSRLF